MSVKDPRTARLLAQRMVNSFFDGLNEAERRQIALGGKDASRSTAFSMLAYTLNVYLGELSLPEEEGREYFQEAIRNKVTQMRETIRQEIDGQRGSAKERDDEKA